MTEPPTLAALNQVRAGRAALRRRLLPVATAILVIVVFLAARKPPKIGLHGASLGLSLALIGFVVGAVAARYTLLAHRERARPWHYGAALGLLLVSSTALVWLQPTGPGVAGFVIALVLVLSARLIPSWAGITLMSACCLAVLLAAAITGRHKDHPSWVGVLVSVLPFALCVLGATMFWRLRLLQEQTERLLAELDRSRSAELRAAALAERQRLARDMHDVLAHTLSGLTLQLEGARLLALSTSDERLARTIDRAHQLAKNGLAEARQAIGMLRGDELPGPDRLAGLAAEFAADTGIPCRFTECGPPREMRAEVKLALYRVTQEALTNIRKHAAGPGQVDVRLDYRPDEVTLTVADVAAGDTGDTGDTGSTGSTAAGDVPGGGYGLAGMRERAELLGGELAAGPTAAGFLVRLAVPA